MKRNRIFVFVAGLMLVSQQASAAVGPVEAGVRAFSLSGNSAQKYDQGLGYQAGFIMTSQPLLQLAYPTARIRYEAYGIKGVTGANLANITVLAGFFTAGGKAVLGLTPTFTALVGGSYIWASIPASTTQNQKLYFTAEVSPGIERVVYGPVSLSYQIAVTQVFGQTGLGIWSHLFTLKVAL